MTFCIEPGNESPACYFRTVYSVVVTHRSRGKIVPCLVWLKRRSDGSRRRLKRGEPIKPCDAGILFERNSHIHPSSHLRTPTTNPTHIRRDIDGFRTRTLLKRPSLNIDPTRFVLTG